MGIAAAAALSGCLFPASADLTIGAATSVRDSGLLDGLVAAFEADERVRARAVVGGTGEMVEKARRGDVDVLLTHSPEREERLLAEGVARARVVVMHNRFLLVGPRGDPAGVAAARNATDALVRVARSESAFASRGDGSGTHDRELALWRAAGIDPASLAAYAETGDGQAGTLRYAHEKGAYALTDGGTWRALSPSLPALVAFSSGDPALVNAYAALPIAAGGARAEAADRFVAWLTGDGGRAAIVAHGAFEPGPAEDTA